MSEAFARLPPMTKAAIVTAINIVSYSCWTMSNKWQFMPLDKGGLNVKFPFIVTAMQMFVAGGTSFMLLLIWYLRNPQGRTADPRLLCNKDTILYRILPLGVSRSIDIGCGNAALVMVTVAFQQVIKSTLPVFVCFLSWAVLSKPVTFRTALTLIPIVAGTVIASAGEIRFSVLGLTLSVVSIMGRAFKAVINAKLLTAEVANLRPLEILYLESPTSGVLLVIIALFVEVPKLMANPELAAHLFSLNVFLFNIFTGILMFFNQLSYISIIDLTSAVTCQILMSMKMLILIIVSVYVFDNTLTVTNKVGIMVAVSGCMWYGMVQRSQPAKRPVNDNNQV